MRRAATPVLNGMLSYAVLLGLLGCAPVEPQAPPESDNPLLRIAGSDTLTAALLPALADTHQRTVGTLRFEIDPGDSAQGIGALLDGTADLAASARDASPSESEQAAVNGFSFDDAGVRHVVAVDVAAVAVHPANQGSVLTYDQVIAIFCTHTISDWEDLGMAPGPIRALTRPPTSGSRALFEDFFCGPRGIHHSVEEVSPAALAAALDADPTVITFVSLSERAGKLLALRPGAALSPVKPTQQNIIRGAYPLYRDVYLFSHGPASGYVHSFLDWIGSPAGQEVVDEQRFVPLFLRPGVSAEARPLRETIHFELGSSMPNSRSLARLELLVEELHERQLSHVILEGFTDDREPNPYALSQERAEAVREQLAAAAPQLYFEVIPRGPHSPLAPNDTPFGRERNRRVQVYLADEEQRND